MSFGTTQAPDSLSRLAHPTQRRAPVQALPGEQLLAATLFLSPLTVRRHLENVFAKLDVRTRTGAVARVFGTAATALDSHTNGRASQASRSS